MMVVEAEECTVVEVSRSSTGVPDQMMRFTPRWWPIATLPATTFISFGEGDPLITIVEPFALTKVQCFGCTVEDDGDEVGVAGEPACLTGTHFVPGGQGRNADLVVEGVEVNVDGDRRGQATM